MEGGKSENETPPLKIDPKCFQDALRAFFQPIKTDDPRLDFYTMYKREATEYDTDYVKKYDEDLNTTLIFAGLFSAVSSAFVIDVHSNLRPGPNEQSAALLRAILLTLNQSAIPGETSTVPSVPEGPPSEIVTTTCLMYASLLISLLAAFVAMLGKQWLNRYLRNSGGSMIERCGDRQRKCDGLGKWPLHFFVESLPVMLQIALLLLVCGLCRSMWSINTLVAYTLITLTGLGVGFYVAIVIAGMSSYACPFQTPASTTLRGPWKKVRRGIVSSIVYCAQVPLYTHWLLTSKVRPFLHRQSRPWLEQKELDIIHRTNTNDVRCVSWILRNITDPEALDAAIRLAGEIRWFDDRINVEPPYDLIVSTFEACFDSTGKLYPGSRDRAYYSGRATIWIRTLAMCKSEEFAKTFPLPGTKCAAPGLDLDLRHLLPINSQAWAVNWCAARLLEINREHTPSHSQWISNVLLHLSWANPITLDIGLILNHISSAHETETIIPLNVTLNRLLVWCIFLGSPVEEEALKVRDKSDRIERILYQLSKAIVPAINGTHAQRRSIQHVLRDLIQLENRPWCLTKTVYEWCSVMCANRQRLSDQESLLLTCLEIGFRHLDVRHPYIKTRLTHTEYHQELVDVVFKSQNSEAIADLLCAWTVEGDYNEPAHSFLDFCAGRLVGLHDLVPFSSRLRRLVIRSVELIGYRGFEGVWMERFVTLLNRLHVKVEDMDDPFVWTKLLLETLQTFEGAQCSSDWYWELLVELAISLSRLLRGEFAYSPQVTTFFVEAQEWGKLECWIGIVWMVWPAGAGGTTEEDLGCSMLSLFRQRPGAVQKLEQWMERWSKKRLCNRIPESFRRICKEGHDTSQRDAPLVSPTSGGTGEYVRWSPSGGKRFWESLPYRNL